MAGMYSISIYYEDFFKFSTFVTIVQAKSSNLLWRFGRIDSRNIKKWKIILKKVFSISKNLELSNVEEQKFSTFQLREGVQFWWMKRRKRKISSLFSLGWDWRWGSFDEMANSCKLIVYPVVPNRIYSGFVIKSSMILWAKLNFSKRNRFSEYLSIYFVMKEFDPMLPY